MKIKGFSNYELLDDGSVINLTTKRIVKETKSSKCRGFYLKLKKDNGLWFSLSKTRVMCLVNELKIPEGFVEIPKFKGYYINEFGIVISTSIYKNGSRLKIQYPKSHKKYPYVNIKGRHIAIHQLIAISFIDEDYLKKGLVAMHIDNNKKNHVLSNIRVGTYSENNKQAYDDGINNGNRGKKVTHRIMQI